MSEIKRMRYFRHEFLDAGDFNDEQEYHRQMRYRHNRDFHTWGIGHGLEVSLAEGQEAGNETKVTVSPGTAVDGDGKEIILPISKTIDFDQPAYQGDSSYYITIKWHEQPGLPRQEDESKRWEEVPDIDVTGVPPENSDMNLVLASVKLRGDKTIEFIDHSDRKYAALEIGDDTVTSFKIADGAVTNAKLADNAVTSSRIADGNVSTSELASGAVTGVKIAANAVTSSKIADGNVGTAELANSAVTVDKLAANAVNSSKIADGNVGTAELANGAVTVDKLAANAVTSSKIADGNVGTAELANSAVTVDKLAANAVNSSKIADGNVGTAELANGAVTEVKLAANAVTSSKIADGNVGTAELANSAVTEAKLAANAVSNLKIKDGSVNENKLDAAAKGKLVANGNSHDHSGGDGAQIKHSSLNKDDGSNPHGTKAGDVGALGIKGGNINGNLAITGNVGIGKVPTTYKFEVQGNALFTGNYLYVNSEKAGRLRVGAAWGMPGLYSSTDGERDLTLGVPGGRKVYLGTGKGDAWVEGGSGNSYFKGNVGIGTTNPQAKLDVRGAIHAANSDIYFTKTDHAHTGIGNSREFAAIENARDYGALMILGRAVSTNPLHRVVKLWDYLEVHGKLWVRKWTVVGADYSEYFESQDGKAIPPGTAVVLENGKVRRANKNETPLGIISANPGMASGVYVEWPQKYLQDEFGNQIMEEYKEEIMAPKKEKVKRERRKMEKKRVKETITRIEIACEDGKYFQKEIKETVEREIEEPVFKEVDLYDTQKKNIIGKHRVPVMETYEEEIDVLDKNGQPVMVGTGKFETRTRPKINPDYDETKEYISREKRPEWNCVGLLGQLPLGKGQPVAPTWIKIKDISNEVELWLVK